MLMRVAPSVRLLYPSSIFKQMLKLENQYIIKEKKLFHKALGLLVWMIKKFK